MATRVEVEACRFEDLLRAADHDNVVIRRGVVGLIVHDADVVDANREMVEETTVVVGRSLPHHTVRADGGHLDWHPAWNLTVPRCAVVDVVQGTGEQLGRLDDDVEGVHAFSDVDEATMPVAGADGIHRQ